MNHSRDSWEKNGSAMASRFTVHDLLDRLEDGDFGRSEVLSKVEGTFSYLPEGSLEPLEEQNLEEKVDQEEDDSGEVEASLQGLFGSEEDLLDL